MSGDTGLLSPRTAMTMPLRRCRLDVFLNQDVDAHLLLRCNGFPVVTSGAKQAYGAADEMPRILCDHHVDVAGGEAGLRISRALVGDHHQPAEVAISLSAPKGARASELRM